MADERPVCAKCRHAERTLRIGKLVRSRTWDEWVCMEERNSRVNYISGTKTAELCCRVNLEGECQYFEAVGDE